MHAEMTVFRSAPLGGCRSIVLANTACIGLEFLEEKAACLTMAECRVNPGVSLGSRDSKCDSISVSTRVLLCAL
jgi:hypothetical protein